MDVNLSKDQLSLTKAVNDAIIGVCEKLLCFNSEARLYGTLHVLTDKQTLWDMTIDTFFVSMETDASVNAAGGLVESLMTGPADSVLLNGAHEQEDHAYFDSNIDDCTREVENATPEDDITDEICGVDYVTIPIIDDNDITLGDGEKGILDEIETNTNASHLCNICNIEFATELALTIHMENDHGLGNKDCNCPYCFKLFVCLNTLNEHLYLHADEAAFRCDQCTKIFHFEFALNRHKARDHLDSIDSKLATTKRSGDVHEFIHINMVFQCETCRQIFPAEDSLREHEVTHTGNSTGRSKNIL